MDIIARNLIVNGDQISEILVSPSAEEPELGLILSILVLDNEMEINTSMLSLWHVDICGLKLL